MNGLVLLPCTMEWWLLLPGILRRLRRQERSSDICLPSWRDVGWSCTRLLWWRGCVSSIRCSMRVPCSAVLRIPRVLSWLLHSVWHSRWRLGRRRMDVEVLRLLNARSGLLSTRQRCNQLIDLCEPALKCRSHCGHFDLRGETADDVVACFQEVILTIS